MTKRRRGQLAALKLWVFGMSMAIPMGLAISETALLFLGMS